MVAATLCHLTPLCFTDSPGPGTTEGYIRNLARGLVEASQGRCQVTLVGYDNKPGRRTLQSGVTLHTLAAVSSARLLEDGLRSELPEIIAGADLVHLHQAATRLGEMSLFLARYQGKPVCISDHGSITSEAAIFPHRLDLADRVLCSSAYGAALVKTARPPEVIKGGADTQFFTPAAVPVLRDRVVCAGRLVSSQGIDRLLAAFPRDLPLTVCGRPEDPNYVRLLRKLAAGKRVEFEFQAGADEVRELYRCSWAQVVVGAPEDCYGRFCELPEQTDLTVLEALACETPVVCMRTSATAEFVSPGETGFVCASLTELIDCLRRLAGDPALVEQLGRQGRRLVLEQFDLGKTCSRLLAVYQHLLASGVASAPREAFSGR